MKESARAGSRFHSYSHSSKTARPLASLLALFLLVFAVFLLLPAGPRLAQAAPADEPDPNYWVTNGAVRSMVASGGLNYIGGEFTYVGPKTGYGVPLDTSSGDPAATYPEVNGVVFATAADGSGGWYIGGNFTSVGGTARNRLAHILSDGTLDPSWDPDANNQVRALAVSGSTVYVGGAFTTLGGGAHARNRLAAIDASGTPTAWNPNADSNVYDLAVSGSTVYAVGDFITLGGGTYSRWHIAAIDASTGVPSATWFPGVNGSVYTLALSGSKLYVGGLFSQVTGTTGGAPFRNNIAAIDVTSGDPTAWNPNADNQVRALAVSSDGNTVYAGGNFTTLGGGIHTRNYLAAIDYFTGAPTAWDPNADALVYSLALSGSTVYAGGAFTTLQGTSGGPYARHHLAAIDSSGNPTSWLAHAGDSVYTLTVSGSTVYAGGIFTSIGGEPRGRLAAIDTDPASATYGQATAWDPDADGNVYAMALSGSTIYAGGAFTTLQGASGGPYGRNRLAAIDTAGTPTSWDPNADGNVHALAVSGTTVYAGGGFTSIQGASGGPYGRNRLAAIDTAGTPTAWNPNANNSVVALAVSGSTIYASGGFTSIQGASGGPYGRNYLAAIDSAGTPTAWNPNANGVVRTIFLSGSTVYAGGDFTTLQGSSGGPYGRNYLAAIDSAGTPTAWNPSANSSVYSLALSGDGSTVYTGGSFTSIQGASGGPYARNCLAAIDSSTGTPTAWDPDADGLGWTLATSGQTIFSGGYQTTIGGDLRPYFAAFNDPPAPGSITPSSGANDGTVSVTNLAGGGFMDGVGVLLRKAGQSDIAATNVVVVSSSQITCDFDLDMAAAGAWDVVVTNLDGQSGTLAGGFTVNQATRTITASAGAGGSINPTGTVVVNYGGSQGFTITPSAGYHVAGVLVDGSSVGAVGTYDFTNVTTDHTINASFAIDTYTITASAGAGGSIAPSGGVSVNHGADKAFSITPDAGWHVADVKVDGASVGAVGAYTFTNVTAAHTISATFASDLSVWYLAEGCTDHGFGCYISVENPNGQTVNVRLTYMLGSGPVAGPTVAMPARSQATIFPSATLGQADFSTRVECLEGQAIAVDRTMFWTGPYASCSEAHCATGVTAPAATWYMPEGCSAHGFECFLLIQNPNGATVTCIVTWMIEGGVPQQNVFPVPANSRATYNMADWIGAADASIKVEANAPVICERAMYRYDRREGHDSTGTTVSAPDYYLAEGCTGYGFTTFILVQNPQGTPTDVAITYQAASGPVAGPSFQMPANSRKTVNVNATTEIPGPDPSFSTHVHGSQPIIAERAMYWDYGQGEACHDSIGLDGPHYNWYLADGQTSEGRETFTLVQNPNDIPVEIRISYLPEGGGTAVNFTDIILPASRKTYNMADRLPSGRASVMVESIMGGPVMVERAMYWNERGTGTDTIGGYSD